MGAISITGKSMGATSLKLTAGKITKTVPVTVLSRNLLAYGPTSGNGLTATVNSDGSLHVTGTATGQWMGVSWTFPCTVQGNVILSRTTSIDGLTVSVKCLDADGGQLGAQVNLGNATAIPAGTVSLRFEIMSSEATPTAKDGDLRIQLESGTTVHDWMRPDNTSLRGGGYELANLYPRVTGLPKTVGANPGITVTAPTPGTYRFKGSTTTAADSWNNLTSMVHVDAGTYTMDATDWPLGNNSWLMGIQAHISHDDGSEGANVFGPRDYGPKTLKAGTLQCNIFIDTTGEVDKTLTPRLYKID
ncbi:hypothetical protein [Bifidobacterium longum]|uniref:hypothetical protein n=1 Tax=Bifidobacterium longum TaxID=216816 RepID=UPI000B297BFE|nr:hypothetical protein [Bifidobacterium longum]